MSTPATAARKYEPLTKPIYHAADLVKRMQEIQDVAFVLSPFTGVSDIPQGWRISERFVFAKWEMEEYKGREHPRGDVYKPFWAKGDSVAPTGQLLNRIWGSAGGSVLFLRRVDDRKEARICEVEGQLLLRQLDANEIKIPCDKRLDLTEGGDGTANMEPDQLKQARKRIHELVMTEALLRGIRKAFSLSQSYSMKDLQVKPFVVYACVPDFDMTDPMTRKMVVASQLGIVDRLFGPSSSTPLLIGGGPEPGRITEPPNGIVDINSARVIDEPPDEGDFPDLPADQPAPPIYVCGCAHGGGCQAEISEIVHKMTVERYGGPRCGRCAPGKKYDEKAHEEMVTLAFPKDKSMTPSKAAGLAAQMRKGA